MKIDITKAFKIIDKVWGKEYWFVNEGLYCCKFLEVYSGHFCSYHYHKKKHETFCLLEGGAIFFINGQFIEDYEKIIIDREVKHSFFALKNSILMEISTHHEDKDSFRLFESGQEFNNWHRRINVCRI